MSLRDPMHKELNMRGFFDPEDINSVIRAINADAGDRLFNAHEVRIGKQKAEHAATERRVHVAILMRHMYIEPFPSVTQLHAFIRKYVLMLTDAERDEQETILLLMHSWLGMEAYPAKEKY